MLRPTLKARPEVPFHTFNLAPEPEICKSVAMVKRSVFTPKFTTALAPAINKLSTPKFLLSIVTVCPPKITALSDGDGTYPASHTVGSEKSPVLVEINS